MEEAVERPAEESGTLDANRRVVIDYTNWRGERALREVIPLYLWWGSDTDRHETAQWILVAWDCKKRARRYFAAEKIHGWTAAPEQIPARTQPETSNGG